jgi:hypothetical protein
MGQHLNRWRKARFANRNSATGIKQRHLALDLGEWVETGKVAELTPRLAKTYARQDIEDGSAGFGRAGEDGSDYSEWAKN